MLEQLKQWLQTFPQWEGTLQLDYTEAVPGNTGLYPKGMTELSCREDVLGNQKLRCSCSFTLQRAAVPGEKNAQWLMDFQDWVARQARLGLAPQFGDEPRTQRIRAYEGKLDRHTQPGCGLYSVQLYVEFTKIYEVN